MEFLIDRKGDGYQRDQVDAYVRELRQTYQQMYESYQVMQRQCEALEQRYIELQKKCEQLETEALLQKQQAGMQYPGYQAYPAQGMPYGMPQYGMQASAQQAMPYGMQGMPEAAPGMPYGMPGGYY